MLKYQATREIFVQPCLLTGEYVIISPSDRREPTVGFLLSAFLSQNDCFLRQEEMLVKVMQARKKEAVSWEEVEHTGADNGKKAKIILFDGEFPQMT